MEENPYKASAEAGSKTPPKRPWWVFYASLLMCALLGTISASAPPDADVSRWWSMSILFGVMAVSMFFWLRRPNNPSA